MVQEFGRGVSKEEIETRVARARGLMKEQGLDLLLVIGRSFYDRMGSLAYMTNHFPPFPAGAFSETVRGMGHGLLVLPLDEPPVLLVDHRNFRREMVHIEDVRPEPNISQEVVNQINVLGAGKGHIGISGEDIMPATMYLDITRALPEAEFANANAIVDGLRARKSQVEVEYLREAALISAAGYEAIFAALKPGVRECDLAAEGHAAGMRAGADFVRYVRVHSGPWRSWGSRWPQATQRRVEAGEFIRFDFVGAFEGYGFDVNRTAVVPGKKLEPKVEAMLDLSAAATEASLDALKDGVTAAEVHEAARKFLDAEGNGAGQYLLPMAGHGIGLETVEAPLLQPGADAVIEEGTVLCVEPNFELPGLGGGVVEEMAIVQKNGYELLTTTATRPWKDL